MHWSISKHSIDIRLAILVFFSTLFLYACSGSSDTQSAPETDVSSPGETSDTILTVPGDTADPTNSTSDAVGSSTGEMSMEPPNIAVSDPVPPESDSLVSTRIDFDITVPAYQSNALQVRLQWGDKDISAQFVVDESWSIVEDFPVDTENELVVTFNDDNGAITLGSFQQAFRTGSSESESFQITADQFDTQSWDGDGDGVSNLDELIAGNDPTVVGSAPAPSEQLLPVQANLELVQDKTFSISWQSAEGAQFYRVLENPDGLSGFSQISDDLAPSVLTFDHRVALHARVNAQYVVQSCNENGCVDSAPVTATGTLDNAIGYIKASNTGDNDNFGNVVSISADGDTLAVGADNEDSSATTVNGDQNDDSGDNGAAYIFVRSEGRWRQQAYLKASNSQASDQFGSSISLSADGNTVAVGAFREDSAATGVNGIEGDDSAITSGAVFVFVRIGELWQQQAYLKASNTDASDEFGRALSLSADGNTLAVGAASEDSAASGINGEQSDNSTFSSGAVYVFVRSGVLWQQQAYLKSSNPELADRFGGAVSLNGDGSTLAIGAPLEDSAATGINGDQSDNTAPESGAVYVFDRNDGLWQQQAYIKASNADQDTDVGAQFGDAISLSASGNSLAVAARLESSAATGINGDQSDNTAPESGAVYVFVRNDGLWQQQAYIKASNTDLVDQFGVSISLSANGDVLAVGTTSERSGASGINGDQNDNSLPFAGAAYVFMRSQGIWQQQAYVKASNPEIADSFGSAVSLSANGDTLAVGARSENSATRGINGDQSDNSERNSGAVYLY